MITLGIFAKTFERDAVGEALAAAQSFGFKAIQFNMSCVGLSPMPDEIPPALLQQTRMSMDSLGLEMAGLSATFNMCHPDKKMRLDGLQRMEVLAQSCLTLNNSLLTLCTGTRDPNDKWKYHPDNSSPQAWLDMCRTMEKAIVLAEQYQLFLGIEPELANVVSNTAKAQQLLSEMATDRIRIILDPANLFEQESAQEVRYRIAEAVDVLGPFISMAHAKDRSSDGQFVAPGKGVIPFDYFLAQLNEADLHVPLVAHGFSETEAPLVAHFLKNVEQINY